VEEGVAASTKRRAQVVQIPPSFFGDVEVEELELQLADFDFIWGGANCCTCAILAQKNQSLRKSSTFFSPFFVIELSSLVVSPLLLLVEPSGLAAVRQDATQGQVFPSFLVNNRLFNLYLFLGLCPSFGCRCDQLALPLPFAVAS
jgi:hypothetical protein